MFSPLANLQRALCFAAVLGWHITARALTVDANQGTGTYNVTSTATVNGLTVGETSTGTLNQSGGTYQVSGQFIIGNNSNTVGVYNLTGGNLQHTGQATIGANGAGTFNQYAGTTVVFSSSLTLGVNSSGTGIYNLYGGSMTASSLTLGINSNGANAFNQNGGTVTFTNGVTIGVNSNGTGAYSLNGGTLATSAITGSNGSTTVNFNGGTVKATGSTTNFISGVDNANVQAGGISIDTQGYSVTIAQNLVHQGATVDGGLTKAGTGTLTLSGNNTYTGGTIFDEGTIKLKSAGAIGTTGTLKFTGGTLEYSDMNLLDYSGRLSQTPDQDIRINTAGYDVTWNSAIVGAGTDLTKTGGGTLTLNADELFTGNVEVNGGTLALGPNGKLSGVDDILVNAGGTLQLGGDHKISNNATLVLNGGTLKLNGYDEFFGGVDVNANSTIDFGSGSGSLSFGNSVGNIWTGTLTFNNFTPGVDVLAFAGLTPQQLANITIYSGSGTTGYVGTGTTYVANIPEPATALLLAVGALLCGRRQRAARRASA